LDRNPWNYSYKHFSKIAKRINYRALQEPVSCRCLPSLVTTNLKYASTSPWFQIIKYRNFLRKNQTE
jgi:hypothetical protein